MFAVLGEITFEVVGSPESFQSVRRYDYAEQRVIESKPRLQWTGDDLERLRLELLLHASVGDPAAQLTVLRLAAAAHQALPLVFGNGGFRGWFVIESIAVRSQQLSAGGAPISIAVGMALKEWAILSELDLLAAALPGFSPLGRVIVSVAAPATAGVSALLSLAAAAGVAAPQLQPSDVPAAAIVRSIAR